ncbi:TetR/AcrR family transcriptional regulator [Lactococcus termiticola]|uniref:TetR family transcriptional regulator n=1 Tax=Lactococcus termiticola TaxID=2169526 RepID=A0A2R5HEX6_9LACT|nr:TetR/AcrR family transcriptional regulator [Lactococcus termiticola]GBG96582.1 TetR family transcriptional regulator [Lactococcus termiticola]
MKKTSKEKLYEAAIALISRQGYDETTVQEIADKAGLTERTFYRQFKDKADVLFDAGNGFAEMIIDHIQSSQASNPIEQVLDGYRGVAVFFDENRERTLLRQRVIHSHPDLEERELLKLKKIEGILLEEMSQSFEPEDAELAVSIGRAIYNLAFKSWQKGSELTMEELLKSAIKRYEGLGKRYN